MRQLTLVKASLICISILSLSACLPAATLVTGAVGVGDSMYKSHQIDDMNKRLERMEKTLNMTLKKAKFKPYVPSYVNMELFNKGLYGK